MPGWVEDDFRAWLRCGILAWGFARVRCDVCAAERLVAFSCKGRGVCPSHTPHRMAEVAAQLTDHVLAPLPVHHHPAPRARPLPASRPARPAHGLRMLTWQAAGGFCLGARNVPAARSH